MSERERGREQGGIGAASVNIHRGRELNSPSLNDRLLITLGVIPIFSCKAVHED